MTDDPQPPEEPMPWDRIGAMLQDMAAVGVTMTDRNLKLWSSISGNLRKRPYTTDKWADDVAHGVEVAMSNVQDAWDFWTRLPERELVAHTVPMAFLVVRSHPDGTVGYSSDGPVWMRVAPSQAGKLPKDAHIDLTGSDLEGVRLLRERLKATLGDAGMAYKLELTSANALRPGLYSGSVYVTEPTVRPIANLRVIVEQGQEPPQAPPVPLLLMRLTRDGEHQAWDPADRMELRAPSVEHAGQLQDAATVDLTGSDQASAQALASALKVKLAKPKKVYELMPTTPSSSVACGSYSGMIYITQPELLAVAQLRVIVESRAAATDG